VKEKPTAGSPFLGAYRPDCILRLGRMSVYISLFTVLPSGMNS